MIDEALQSYLEAHSSPEPANLARLSRRVGQRLLYPRMCSGHLQGRVLAMLTAMIAPRRALEIGTYAGYSALCIAEGLPDDEATLDTIEIDDEMEDFIRAQLSESPYGHRVRLHIGDASEVLPCVASAPSFRPYDMAYIDANKRTYLQTYEQVLPLLRPGGFIIADNTLWDGKVLPTDTPTDNPAHHLHDPQTAGIIAFNDFVAADPRVTAVMLPLRDGLTLLCKLP